MKSDELLLEQFITSHAVDAARILEQLSIDEIVELFDEIPENLSTQILKRLEPFIATKCLQKMNIDKSAILATKLPIQITTAYLNQINPELRETILQHMPQETANALIKILQYSTDSAGGLADPFILTLPDDITVKEAMQRIQKRDTKANHYIYIVNRHQELTGVTSIKKLMYSNPVTTLKEIIFKDIVALNANLTFQAILKHSGWQFSHVLPVVDDNKILIGVLRYHTLRQLEQEKQTDTPGKQIVNTTNALGELYQIGLSGLIKTAMTVFEVQPDKNKS